ncbi:unnamed protein product, partial [Ectocarpus sp. 12 AP-2014]
GVAPRADISSPLGAAAAAAAAAAVAAVEAALAEESRSESEHAGSKEALEPKPSAKRRGRRTSKVSSRKNMPVLAAVAETDEAVGSDDAGWPPSPYGIYPGLAGAPRATPDYARKTWKAYHERQALLAGRRQYSRPVEVDPVVWGDLIGRKLAELIEGERNHPRRVVRGGAADRD